MDRKQAALLRRYVIREFDELNLFRSGDAPQGRDEIIEQVREYLEDSYLDGYTGVHYKLGIPLIYAGLAALAAAAVGTPVAGETFEQRIRALPPDYDPAELERIITTEGHRVYVTAQLDASGAIGQSGRMLMKRWDATLDGKTRETHRLLDGTLLRMEERFVTVNGSALAPGQFGVGEEDVNCRCILEILDY